MIYYDLVRFTLDHHNLWRIKVWWMLNDIVCLMNRGWWGCISPPDNFEKKHKKNDNSEIVSPPANASSFIYGKRVKLFDEEKKFATVTTSQVSIFYALAKFRNLKRNQHSGTGKSGNWILSSACILICLHKSLVIFVSSLFLSLSDIVFCFYIQVCLFSCVS